ncbi:NADH dehydrogenase subunit E [Roseibium hamelinense]|uniref:NADH dehydrogenase subunit E n=1 Tax=Roseibium hamelinense TaxID=150831 RepID=A0A562TI15_9HYPH|nr:NADH-quinone oxidoreductase subunit E [Roseibium hamelinense]MTI45993.1 NADH-quinone oxidoreductase subunit E [Roseibium hamelinense]TWI92818.1 NADH dehydrogenase subunit E [Roseibium hamelinense]
MAVRRLAAEQPESFEFTPENLAWAKKLIDRYPSGRQASAVIPLLWRAQEQNEGWVSEPAIRRVADLLDMPHIRVLEVATFYTMFQLQPVGKKAHIQVCGTTPCMLRGAGDLINVCKSRIAKHMHELSEDGLFSWEEVECLGACVNAPMVQIFKDTYEDLTEESFNTLLDNIEAGREVTPGPQNGRRFAMAEGGQTSLTEINDNTKGGDPEPHVVDGAEKASHVFAGKAINAGGKDFDGVPTPADEAVDKVKGAFAAKSGAAKAEAAPAAKPAAETPASPKIEKKVEKAEKTPEPAPVSKAKPDEVSEASAVEEKEPELLKEARGGKPDDLKKLKGVGPKLEGILHELGVFHFDQIASWGAKEIAWVDERLKFKGRIERDGWVDQAKLLAGGGETEFSKRVDAGDVASSKDES